MNFNRSNDQGNTPADPRAVCRKFLWGTCTKVSAQCKFKHIIDVDSMRKHLRFCHNFQNACGCNSEDCTYLHTSKEEEDLFWTKNLIPEVLLKRYASMSAASGEPMPQLYGPYVSSNVSRPPPPPPSKAPPPPAAVPAAVPMPMTSQTHIIPSWLWAPPPPPPPSPPPVTETFQPPVQTPTIAQRAPLVIIDTSKPPPPLPHRNVNANGAVKRRNDLMEAGPSKKPCTSTENCDSCRERLHRIEEQELVILREYCELLALKKATEIYEEGKLKLRTMFNPEQARLIEKYLDEGPQPFDLRDILPPVNDSSLSTNSTRQLLFQLMDAVVGNMNVIDTVNSYKNEDALLQAIAVLTRRPVPAATGSDSSDLFKACMKEIQGAVESIRHSSSRSSAGAPTTTAAVTEPRALARRAPRPPSPPFQPSVPPPTYYMHAYAAPAPPAPPSAATRAPPPPAPPAAPAPRYAPHFPPYYPGFQ